MFEAFSETNTDCLVIGGGPAGLTAAIYLARFRRKVIICDDESSRASLIPHSFNYPGFSQGISRAELLKNLQAQAKNFKIIFYKTKIQRLIKNNDNQFIASTNTLKISAQKVILATGIIDKKPSFPSMKEFIYQGAIRFCPICDGYEAINKRIGVVGPFSLAYTKAIFLRTFSTDVTILTNAIDSIPDDKKQDITNVQIKISEASLVDLKLLNENITAVLADGNSLEFDVLYPAMGCIVRSQLAKSLRAKTSQEGHLITDNDQMTNIDGLYAIGDVAKDLAQISVGTGQAAIAATSIHKKLKQVFANN